MGPGGRPRVVCLRRAAQAVPEWLRLLAGRASDQNVEVRVPAGSDAQQVCAIGQAPMDQGEQHLVAFWLQLKGNVAAALPGNGELAARIELGNTALHPAL